MATLAEVAGVPDADLQRALAGVANELLAALLPDAPAAAAEKIVANLSPRRREEVRSLRGPYPERTRLVAEQVLLRAVFGGEEPKPPPASGVDCRTLLDRIARVHPDFRDAREAREAALWAEYFRRLFPSGEPRA